MLLQEFLEKAKKTLPPYINDVSGLGISEVTKIYFHRLLALCEEIDESELLSLESKLEKVGKRRLMGRLSLYTQSILQALHYFQTSPEKCDIHIYHTFLNPETGVKDFFITPIPAKGPVYRMRCDEDINKLEESTAKDMFHIPFNFLFKTSNQRFSRKGYPFLYAGNSAQICWEELNRPHPNKCHLSVLRLERHLKLFDLRFPVKIEKIEDILRLPLIIACSIKYSEGTDRSEYIIPQAVLRGVMEYNKINRDKLMVFEVTEQVTEIPTIDGILYLSTKISEEPKRIDENDCCNYVFPILVQNSTGFCPQLCEKFTISEPITLRSVWHLYKNVFGQDTNYSEFSSICEKCSPIQLFKKGEEILKSKHIIKIRLSPAT